LQEQKANYIAKCDEEIAKYQAILVNVEKAEVLVDKLK
jgi:hypothetical protein